MKKYFVEERLRMMPMPYWWQLLKWVVYTWRILRYIAWKRRGKHFRKCIVCKTKLKNNYCNLCQTDYKKWMIEPVDEIQYVQLLKKMGKIKTPDNKVFIDNSLAQALEKSSLQPLENHLKGIEKTLDINWTPLTEKLKAKLNLRFTKFPIITRKDIAEYHKNNPTT